MEEKKVLNLKQRVANLLSIKSVVTVTGNFVFAYLAIAGVITAEQFLTIFTVIIGFYFGTQKQSE